MESRVRNRKRDDDVMCAIAPAPAPPDCRQNSFYILLTIVIRLNLYVRIIVNYAVNHTYHAVEEKAVEPRAMTSHTITILFFIELTKNRSPHCTEILKYIDYVNLKAGSLNVRKFQEQVRANP